MEYKVGDRVRIKSVDWYNENKNHCGEIPLFKPSGLFVPDMSRYCNNIMTIKDICYGTCYRMKEDFWNYNWTDEMIEGLVEEEGKETSWKPSKEEMDVLYSLAYITNKYDEHKEEVITRLYQDLKREFFNDSSYENMFPNTENDVRRRSTIQVLEYARSLDSYNQYGKADIDKNIAWLEKQGKSALEARTDNELVEDEAGLVDNLSSRWVNEFNLPQGYIFKDENGNVINATKIVLEKKKKEYPKTYTECSDILSVYTDPDISGYKGELLWAFQKLLVCRDAYWKLYGEEMGLGKPWEPDWNNISDKYCIYFVSGDIWSEECQTRQCPFAFPTPEMRDEFYENFKEEIESVKGLL